MENDNTKEIGKFAATLSIVEIGLGSLLHSFKIPLTGHFLSLNQIAILARGSAKIHSKDAGLKISIIAALLKSLSPAGKKLTPMLAIAAQGMLFSLGLITFGINPLGFVFAAILSSLWAFIQPVLFIYILFGQTSIEVAEHFLKEFGKLFSNADEILLALVIAVILGKVLLAVISSLLAYKLSDEHFEKYTSKIIHKKGKSKKVKQGSAHYLAIRDLLNPLFILSFVLTAIFFFYSNTSLAQTIWGLLRPLAIGFILFYIIRIYPVEKLSELLKKKGFLELGESFDHAIKIIRERREE